LIRVKNPRPGDVIRQDCDKGDGPIRRILRLIGILVIIFTVTIGVLLVLTGPILTSRTFLRTVERVLFEQTGLSCHISRVSFDYPFDLTLFGLSLEGETSGWGFRISAEHAHLETSLKTLISGNVDDIIIRSADVWIEKNSDASNEYFLQTSPA